MSGGLQLQYMKNWDKFIYIGFEKKNIAFERKTKLVNI